MNIYLSSTDKDLKGYRKKVCEALHTLGHVPIAMEYYVSADKWPVDECLADVDRADLYIGLFAWRYGFVPPPEHNNPRQLSMTELEYRKAFELGKPRLIFLLDESFPWCPLLMDSHTDDNESGKRIADLRQELEKERLLSHFKSEDELARLVTIAVERWCSQNTETPGTLPLWEGCPFKGLHPFQPEDAPIYFGRDRETEQLVEMLCDPAVRFVAVVGASGSGRSSLIGAGLIPRLQDNTSQGKRWSWIRFTPGERGGDPFLAMAYELAKKFPDHGWSHRERERLAGRLRSEHMSIYDELARPVADDNDVARLLLFLDQFEELFTLCPPDEQKTFIEFLETVTNDPDARICVVATLRGDFYHEAVNLSSLSGLLRGKGTFPLAPPGTASLYQMIAEPSKRAGLDIDGALIDRIIKDTGTEEPGRLALMSFTLRELWDEDKKRLTEDDYDHLGGVSSVIAKRAEDTVKDTFRNVESAKLDEVLRDVFRELVDLNDRGEPTRKRANLSKVKTSTEAGNLVEALTDANLLVRDKEDNETIVEVAHSALFTSWPRLKKWIEDTMDDRRLRRRITQLADDWQKDGRNDRHRWPDDRVDEVVKMLERLRMGTEDLSKLERDYLEPLDRERMLAEIKHHDTEHERRAMIGRRLSCLSDERPGVGLRDKDKLPDIEELLEVKNGEIYLEVEQTKQSDSPSRVEPRQIKQVGPIPVKLFYLAKYPVTYIQYRAFLEAEDGFNDPKWWNELWWMKKQNEYPRKPGTQVNQRDNHPAENVAWVEAVAFCRWLDTKLRDEIRERYGEDYQIRLPTEWEWQQAATGGSKNKYPWREYDLRLMSVDTAADLQHEGCTLLIVAVVGADLHIRIFDDSGEIIVDKPAKDLVKEDTEADLADLKKRLSLLPKESLLSQEEKWEIINSATSIAGLTRANTLESKLSCSTAVGMYPAGASPTKALDMAGNVWEWCLNEFYNPESTDLLNDNRRVCRGGSWSRPYFNACVSYRGRGSPSLRNLVVGFRLACGPILDGFGLGLI